LSYDFVSTLILFFFFSSRRRHTRSKRDWSSDVCSSDLNSDSLGAPRRENPRQVVVDHRRLSFAVQRRRYALVGLLRGQPLHQRQIGRASCRERVEMLVGGGG